MRCLSIGDTLIGGGAPVFVIAEAGVNHNGDLDLARQMVDAAVDAGADAVKFQTYQTTSLLTPTAPKAEYQLQTSDPVESQFEMLRKLELSASDHRHLLDYCAKKGIIFLSSPFDDVSLDLLLDLDIPALKIPSGELTDTPMLEKIARSGKPVILSTGMCYLREVDEAVSLLRRLGCSQLALLQCVSSYPAHPADINLRAMLTMASAFQVPVGYSDHTPGSAVTLAAVALGACIIEKHFTLDRNLPGPDHQTSFEPDEFRELVSEIRTVEAALGNGRKEPAASELLNVPVGRKSLTTTKALRKHDVLTREMVSCKRPGTGIEPKYLEMVVGKRLTRDVDESATLTWDMFFDA